LVKLALSQNISVPDIVEKGLRPGFDIVGQKYEKGEYFLSELIFAAATLDKVMQVLKPLLSTRNLHKKGTILLGTIHGDIHDIGKNIFKWMAESAGFSVQDLGVDVDPEHFIQESKRLEPDILGLSCLLTTGLPEIKVVTDMLNQTEIRSNLKVLIGGNAVTKEFAQQVGAHAALDAIQGVEFCKKLR
jgi:methanogenic corrinoid protein MtbC1